METMQSFVVKVKHGDFSMFLDINGGNMCFFLHPDMQNMFPFRYGDRFYRCIVQKVGWGSGLWTTKLVRPLVQRLPDKENFRIMVYLDDSLFVPSPVGSI